MDMYARLPDFTGPNMLPEERMAHFRDNIRPNMQYCGLVFVPRLTKWCHYIKEYDSRMKLLKKNISYVSSQDNYTTISSIITPDADCYDSYYCNVQSLAGVVHSLMVAMCIITLIAIIANLFCFIKMHLKFNRNFVRNSFGIYLSAIILVDCLKLVLLCLLFIVPALSSNQYGEQLSMYQKYTFKLVPVLLPLLDLSFSIVSWFVVAMLVQRSNVTRTKLIMEAEGFGSANVSSKRDRRRTNCCMTLIVVALAVFMVPKFAEYTYSYHMSTGEGIVIPLLRVLKLYRIVYLKFLSPSVECMIPIIVMLAYIAVIKYNEALLARHRHQRAHVVGDKTHRLDSLVSYNSTVLSATGISRKTQLVIWLSVVVLVNLLMKLSAVFVELERNLEGSPREEWPRLRQITRYLSVVISIISVAAKPVIYLHCCPRLLNKNLSRESKDDSVDNV